jgi:hypothetical protein
VIISHNCPEKQLQDLGKAPCRAFSSAIPLANNNPGQLRLYLIKSHPIVAACSAGVLKCVEACRTRKGNSKPLDDIHHPAVSFHDHQIFTQEQSKPEDNPFLIEIQARNGNPISPKPDC